MTLASSQPGNDHDPAELRQWLARIGERLRASGDPAQLAIDLLIEDLATWSPAAWARQRDAVALAALGGSTFHLHALALKACSRGDRFDLPGDGLCDQLTLDNAMRVASNNVWLWLTVARDAHRHDDRPRELDALYRASTSTEFELPYKAALTTLAAAMPSDVPGWVRYTLLQRLWNDIGGRTDLGGLHAALAFTESCAGHALDDSTTSSLCERIARHLLDDSTSSDTLWVGVILARYVHWTTGRLETLEQDAQLMADARQLLPTPLEAVCGNLSNAKAQLQALMTASPLALLRTEPLRSAIAAAGERRDRAIADGP